MRVFKTIVNILLIIVFILSITFNFLIMGSSYGTLVFKHSDRKLISMASAQRLEFEPSYFLLQKNQGIQISKKTKTESNIVKEEYKFYFDKKYNLTTYVLNSKQTGDSFNKDVYYSSNNKCYDGEGKENSNICVTSNIPSNILTELNVYQDALIEDVETTKTKSKVHFSFSPFYFIGIKYTIKNETATVTYKYDLKGQLRKIEISYKTGVKETYSINYKDNKVSIPNLKK